MTKTAMKLASSMTAAEIALLDRAVFLTMEIERIDKLIMDTPIPRLGVDSIEDVDDLYQAKLEWRWEQDDRENNIAELKAEKELIKEQLQ